MSAPTPTPEQEQRAKWDLLLLDIEMRSEQLRQMKTYDPIEVELRTEKLRQLKVYEPRKLVLMGLTSGAALLGAGAALGAFLARLG